MGETRVDKNAHGGRNTFFPFLVGSGGAVRTFVDELGETEVHELKMALGVEQHVLRFEVAICDTVLVEVLQHQRDFGSVKSRRRLREAPRAPEIGENFAAGAVVKLREAHCQHSLSPCPVLHQA